MVANIIEMSEVELFSVLRTANNFCRVTSSCSVSSGASLQWARVNCGSRRCLVSLL